VEHIYNAVLHSLKEEGVVCRKVSDPDDHQIK
jgi:hypothetical protein